MESQPDSLSKVQPSSARRVLVAEDQALDVQVAQVILDALFTFIGVFSADGVILEVNRAPLEAAGLRREDVVGRRFVDLPWWSHSARERQRISDAIARAARGEHLRFDTNVRRLRGDIMYVDAAFAPLTDDRGGVTHVVGSGVDVTQRYQAEAARARGEALLAETQRVSHVGSWEWDIRHNTVTWSDELYRIYGLEPGAFAVTYQGYLDRVHPDDRSHSNAVIERALRDVSPFVYEHRIVRPDGSVRMLDTRGEVFAGPDGKPVRMVGSCFDVTARWEAGLKLERSVSLLTATLEATADGVLVVDRDGKVAAFNRRFLALWRLTEEMVTEKDDRALLAAVRDELEDPEGFEARVRQLYASGAEGSLDVLRFRDGRVFERYSCPQRVGGEVVGRVWSFRDITQHERLLRSAEQARGDAEDARHELTHILDRISDGFVALDSAWRYTYVNRCAGQMLGREPASLIGKHIWSEFPEGRGQKFHLAYERAAAQQVPIQLREFYPPWKRWYENRIYPSPDGLSIFFSDVTEDQRRDEELHSTNEQLRALGARLEATREEERRQLARELHDQLGQALTALKLDVTWLGMRGGGGGGPEIEARLQTMQRTLDETLETTRRLSAELRPELLDDLGLPAAVAWQVHQLEARSGVTFQLDMPAPEALALDPRRALALYRVLQEALTNVVRHAHARHVQVRLALEGDDVVLVIGDDGRGITDQQRDDPRSLGLLGMRERAAALGGRLTVQGAPGAGTTVTARIPRAAGAA
jgi:PAS domain S-box-containing protein